MQHMPFLRSKFRIKKKTGPTKTGTLRNSHAIEIGERANVRRSFEKAKFHLACERALCFAFPLPSSPLDRRGLFTVSLGASNANLIEIEYKDKLLTSTRSGDLASWSLQLFSMRQRGFAFVCVSIIKCVCDRELCFS